MVTMKSASHEILKERWRVFPSDFIDNLVGDYNIIWYNWMKIIL